MVVGRPAAIAGPLWSSSGSRRSRFRARHRSTSRHLRAVAGALGGRRADGRGTVEARARGSWFSFAHHLERNLATIELRRCRPTALRRESRRSARTRPVRPRAIDGIDDQEWNSGASPGSPGPPSVDPGTRASAPACRATSRSTAWPAPPSGPAAAARPPRGSGSSRWESDPRGVASPWPSPSFQGGFLPPVALWEPQDPPLGGDPGLAERSPTLGNIVPAGVFEAAFGADSILAADSYFEADGALGADCCSSARPRVSLLLRALGAPPWSDPVPLVGAALIVFYLLLLSLSNTSDSPTPTVRDRRHHPSRDRLRGERLALGGEDSPWAPAWPASMARSTRPARRGHTLSSVRSGSRLWRW